MIQNDIISTISGFKKKPLKKIALFSVFIGLSILTVVILVGTYNFEFTESQASFNILSLAAILASLLAITFSISLVTVQIVSNMYTPRILDVYKKNKIVYGTLSIFLGTIIGFLLLSTIPVPSKILNAVCMGGFFLCCVLLLIFFYEVLSIIDSLKLAKILENEGNTAILKKDYEQAELEISCVGDIILKTIDRKEEETSKTYLEVLSKFIDAYSTLPNDPQPDSQQKRNQKLKSDIIESIFSEYFRIFRTTIQKNDLKIRDDLIEQTENIFFEYYLKNVSIIQAIQKLEVNTLTISIKKSDEIRFKLISNYINHVGAFVDKQAASVNFDLAVDEELTKSYLDSSFLLINKEIIKNDDYGLFESEIDAINGWKLSEPCFFINKIRDELLFLKTPILSTNINPTFEIALQKNLTVLRKIGDINLLDNFENFQENAKKIYSFRKFIVDGLDEITADIQNQKKIGNTQSKEVSFEDQLAFIANLKNKIQLDIDKILNLAYQHHVISIFYRSLFIKGVIILKFDEETDTKFGSKKYIRQLMGLPNVRNGIESRNNPPIVKNADWLTHLFVYGGQNNQYWALKKGLENNLDLNSDALSKFYLLAIASITSDIDRHLSLPTLRDIEILYRECENIEVIERHYSFSNRFLDKSDCLILEIDKFIQNADKFEYLFGTQSQERLENTKFWVEESIKKFSDVKKNIESVLPIDPEMEGNCIKEIYHNFDSVDRLPRIVETRQYNSEIDIGKPFETWCYPQDLHPKQHFIKISQLQTVGLGTIFAHATIQSEYDQIAQKILKHIQDKRSVTGDSLEEKIAYLSTFFKSSKRESTLLCSQKILSLLKQKNFIKRVDKLDLGDNLFVRINGSTEIPDEVFIVIQKNAGVLISQINESTQKRLFVSINEDQEDKSMVKLSVCIKIHFEILRPGGIQIINFAPKTTESR